MRRMARNNHLWDERAWKEYLEWQTEKSNAIIKNIQQNIYVSNGGLA